MSLKPQEIAPVPQQTEQVCRAAFPDGNPYLKIRDQLGVFYQDDCFAPLFAPQGQPALCPWRLALVTVLQFAEKLTDRQAADAVRSRLDWKYILSLELTDPGFHFSVLSTFRQRLIAGEAEQLLLEKMLTLFKERGLLKAKGKQRTDATHVLANIRTLNRLELVGQTLVETLEVVATVAPEWLKAWVPSDWADKYCHRVENYRLPKEKKQRQLLAQTIGTDGHQLLAMIYSPTAPVGLASVEAVEVMRQIWVQQFYLQDQTVQWRESGNFPPSAVMLSSPYDTSARYSTKRDTTWVGYKVHLTETCDDNSPNFITHVSTTRATEPDCHAIGSIHTDLSVRQLLPDEHIVDTAYITTDSLVKSHQQKIDLVGPIWPDNSWQAKTPGAFDSSKFQIDWQNSRVVCPMGKTSRYFCQSESSTGRDKIVVQFDKSDCKACGCRSRCTKSKSGARQLTLAPEPEHEALVAARQRQQQEDFKTLYQSRAGIEGTISQATRSHGLRRSRYRGLAKTHLGHVLTAAAMNLTRAADWLMEKTPAQTRKSRLAALVA